MEGRKGGTRGLGRKSSRKNKSKGYGRFKREMMRKISKVSNMNPAQVKKVTKCNLKTRI